MRLYIRDSTGKIREERTHRNTFVIENISSAPAVTGATVVPTTAYTAVAETTA